MSILQMPLEGTFQPAKLTSRVQRSQVVVREVDKCRKNDKLVELYEKRAQLEQEIRWLKKSLHFFENVLAPDQKGQPDINQFKQRLTKALVIKKRMEMAILALPLA